MLISASTETECHNSLPPLCFYPSLCETGIIKLLFSPLSVCLSCKYFASHSQCVQYLKRLISIRVSHHDDTVSKSSECSVKSPGVFSEVEGCHLQFLAMFSRIRIFINQMSPEAIVLRDCCTTCKKNSKLFIICITSIICWTSPFSNKVY